VLDVERFRDTEANGSEVERSVEENFGRVGDVARARGDVAVAAACFEEALEIDRAREAMATRRRRLDLHSAVPADRGLLARQLELLAKLRPLNVDSPAAGAP